MQNQPEHLSRRSLVRAERALSAAVAPAPLPRQSLRRTALSLLTMVFVAAMTIVTTIPGSSLLTPADVAAASAPVAEASGIGSQSPGLISGGADVPISRDEYSVTSLRDQLAAASAGRAGAFTNDTSWDIQWPFAWGVPMSDRFGPRVLCSTCGVTQHNGVDFLPGVGAPIQAIADGVVRYVEESDEGLGVHVIIDHQVGGRLVSSVYCHMQVDSVAMSVGEQVKVGQLVGLVGETGFAFGPHLHFEIREGATQQVDPVAWLEANAG
jgi:murein DD-endopeptidase MepM/ murein hydrolase activator NlpD